MALEALGEPPEPQCRGRGGPTDADVAAFFPSGQKQGVEPRQQAGGLGVFALQLLHQAAELVIEGYPAVGKQDLRARLQGPEKIFLRELDFLMEGIEELMQGFSR
jgi:hypothetical protein